MSNCKMLSIAVTLALSVSLITSCSDNIGEETSVSNPSESLAAPSATTTAEVSLSEPSPTPEIIIENMYDDIHVSTNWDIYSSEKNEEVHNHNTNIYTRLTDDFMYKYEAGTAVNGIVPYSGFKNISVVDSHAYSDDPSAEDGVVEFDMYSYGFTDLTGRIVCDSVYCDVEYDTNGYWLAKNQTSNKYDIYSADGEVAITDGYDTVKFYHDKIFCFNYSSDGQTGYAYILDFDGKHLQDEIAFECNGLKVLSILDDTHIFLCENGEISQPAGIIYVPAYVDLNIGKLHFLDFSNGDTFSDSDYPDFYDYSNISIDGGIAYPNTIGGIALQFNMIYSTEEYSEVKYISDENYLAWSSDDYNTAFFINQQGNILNTIDDYSEITVTSNKVLVLSSDRTTLDIYNSFGEPEASVDYDQYELGSAVFNNFDNYYGIWFNESPLFITKHNDTVDYILVSNGNVTMAVYRTDTGKNMNMDTKINTSLFYYTGENVILDYTNQTVQIYDASENLVFSYYPIDLSKTLEDSDI